MPRISEATAWHASLGMAGLIALALLKYGELGPAGAWEWVWHRLWMLVATTLFTAHIYAPVFQLLMYGKITKFSWASLDAGLIGLLIFAWSTGWKWSLVLESFLWELVIIAWISPVFGRALKEILERF